MGTPHLSANQLTVWTALFIGLIIAVMLGSAVGSSDIRFVAGVLALVPLVIVIVNSKAHIWVLIPIGWYLGGRLPFLPIPFTLRDLCIMIPLAAFTLFFALRTHPWKRKIDTLDRIVLINFAYLVTVYFRNPVGTWAFQSSVVGGRPYWETVLAMGAFVVLSRVMITPWLAKVFPLFFLIPAAILAALELLARLVPQTAAAIGLVYSGVSGASTVSALVVQNDQLGQTRFTAMKELGTTGVLALSARHSPSKLISPAHPLLVLMLVGSFLAVFLSGFRSAFLFAMVGLLLSSILRRQLRDIWIGTGGIVLVVAFLISVQGSVLQLPMTMQRTLSWLPGDWSEEARKDAEGSSEWRHEMVYWAWNDERIIKDKIWGQGFGISIEDMNIIASALMAGQQGGMFMGGSDRENFMLTGSFHNGPVSTIRYVGVVGLVLYYVLLCYMALFAWRLCRRALDTEAFPLALFISIPVIYEPFNFVFVFGGFDSGLPQTIFWAGLLNMASNYLDKVAPPKASQSERRSAQLRSPSSTPANTIAGAASRT